MAPLSFFRKRFSRITDDEVRGTVEIIWNILSLKPFDENDLSKALKHLSDILQHAPNDKIFNLGPKKIIHCSITIIFFYNHHVHRFGVSKSKNEIKKNRARFCYKHLLEVFVPRKSEEIVKQVIKVLTREKFWDWEDLCEILINDLLEFGASGSVVLNSLITKAGAQKINTEDAKKMIRVLYTILENYSWPDTDETTTSIERLLTIYQNSTKLFRDQSQRQILLRKGLEICIRNASDHLPNHHLLSIVFRMCSWTIQENSNEEAIHEFARTLEYAASIYKTDLFEETLREELFLLLMSMISSQNRLVSLLGNRILQHLIDRKGNRNQFETLRTFFEDTNYEINVNTCNKRDKEFLKTHREVLHDSFVESLMNHCSSKLVLEATYTSLCLIAVENPCGFTAAALSCLVMNFQDLMVEHTEIKREVSYQVHAMVISIMTLICWIHRARIFYSYVNKIMMERAQYAPHLNPPLAMHYDFAVHHVLWDKPELFFVDWEVRYGLWKCFRSQQDEIPTKHH